MTAKETIDRALTLTTDSSMYELAQAQGKLRRCSDLVTSPELIEDWMRAWQHVEETKIAQDAIAHSGQPVRIM